MTIPIALMALHFIFSHKHTSCSGHSFNVNAEDRQFLPGISLESSELQMQEEYLHRKLIRI